MERKTQINPYKSNTQNNNFGSAFSKLFNTQKTTSNLSNRNTSTVNGRVGLNNNSSMNFNRNSSYTNTRSNYNTNSVGGNNRQNYNPRENFNYNRSNLMNDKNLNQTDRRFSNTVSARIQPKTRDFKFSTEIRKNPANMSLLFKNIEKGNEKIDTPLRVFFRMYKNNFLNFRETFLMYYEFFIFVSRTLLNNIDPNSL